jgi:hypothetical protein
LILSGTGAVDSTATPGASSYTSIQESGRWYSSESNWKEWQFRSNLPRVSIPNENEIPDEPIIALHSPPFTGGAHALREWLYKDKAAWKAERGSSPGEIVTIVPDARIRISNTQWDQGHLNVELDINAPEQEYELQVLYGGSTQRRHEIVKATPGQIRLEIPEDTEAITLFIIDNAGELLAQHAIGRPADAIPTTKASTNPSENEEDRIRTELLSGENSTVEFKPFVEPKDLKEAELVKTIVAFSNTEGGRLYIGVDDSGTPQGASELKKASKRTDENVEQHLKVLIDRLEQLIRTSVKPQPNYKCKVHDKEGRPVVIVEVKKGDQPPYANLQNEYFVRHGSSSMRPDPNELRSLLNGSGGISAALWMLNRRNPW